MNSPPEDYPGLHRGPAAFAIKRPVTMGMIFLSLMVVGAAALQLVPLQLLPEGLNPPFLGVWVVYPNVSPAENMERIATPIEDILSTIKGVKEINSRSNNSGAGIWIEFDQATDMDVAYLSVRDKLTRVRPELPADLRYLSIRRYNEGDEPVLYFGVTIHGNYDDPVRLVQDEIVKRLERIDGVAAVEMWGGDAKIILIDLSLERLKAHNVQVGALVTELRNSNFMLSAGVIEDADQRLILKVNARLTDLEQLSELPLSGGTLKLSDIATISYASPPTTWIQRIGGKSAIQLGVMKESEANTVELTRKLNEELNLLRNDPRFVGLEFDVLFDQGKYIMEALRNLVESGLWGGFFAMIVLYYFLRRIRMTLFVTLSIPICLLATIIYIYFIGWSLDLVTLTGLMICVGMVVDNAIVVVENIHVEKQHGAPNLLAAIKGTSGVALAITMATGTTVVVFVPIMLMSGDRMFSFYMLHIGMPLILALVASLFVALFFIPLAVQRFALEGSPVEPPLLLKFEIAVEKMVRWTLQRRTDALLILLLALGSIAFPISKVVSTDQEEGDIGDFSLRFAFPAYYTLAEIDSTMRGIETFFSTNQEKYDIKTVVTGFRRGYGRMRVFLNEQPANIWITDLYKGLVKITGLRTDTRLDRKEIIKKVKDSLQVPAGVEMFTGWNRGAGEEDVEYVTIFGEDTQMLMAIVDDVSLRLNDIPGVLSIETDLESASDEVRVTFDRDATTRRRVDPMTAAFSLTSLIRGVDLNEYNWEGRLIPVRAQLQESDRTTIDQFKNLPVGSAFGSAIRLEDVALVSTGKGLGEITRENHRTRVRIKITSGGEDVKELSDQIDVALAGMQLPTGYEWTKGQRFQDIQEAEGQRSNAWILAIVFVFLLMGALFESFLLPLAVITTVPFAFFGVWWILWLTGTQFGIMAGVGVVILIGVVVNNAILLVDRVNTIRQEGVPRDEALARASRDRLRPIAMTALTTIFGLIPMAIGSANLIGIPYSPMGRTMIGGMLTATITTPLVVPLFYSYLDDLKLWFARAVASFREKT